MNLEITNKHLEKLQNNKFFKHNIYRILSNEIKTVKDYCDVEDDLGCIHNLMFSSLFDEHKLKINSALDKKDFLIKTLMSKNYYSGYEVIGEFIRGDVPIEINTKYGICKIKPNQLLQGIAPSIRSAVNKNQYFINMAIEIHSDLFDYSKVNWVSATKKVEILCKTHGSFFQTPNNHLNNRGCDKCRHLNSGLKSLGWTLDMWIKTSEKSKNFDSYKVYIIKCFNENEKFYKIGRTFTTIYERYKYRFIYDYEIMYEYEGYPEDCYNLEIKLKQVNKNNKYKPNIKFNGYTECFSKIDMSSILVNK